MPQMRLERYVGRPRSCSGPTATKIGHYRPVTFDIWSMRWPIAKVHCSPHYYGPIFWESCTRQFHTPVSAAKLPATHEAVRNLVSRDDAVVLNALADAAAVNDQFLRRTAIEVIGRHPRGRELSAIILGALGDTSGYVVRTACDVVAQWKLWGGARPCAASPGERVCGHPTKRDPGSWYHLGRYGFFFDIPYLHR
jgi:hypothetical protein